MFYSSIKTSPAQLTQYGPGPHIDVTTRPDLFDICQRINDFHTFAIGAADKLEALGAISADTALELYTLPTRLQPFYARLTPTVTEKDLRKRYTYHAAIGSTIVADEFDCPQYPVLSALVFVLEEGFTPQIQTYLDHLRASGQAIPAIASLLIKARP